MANTATRLITLIMLLQRRPNQKAAELAEELGVSVRTIHRYVATLDDMGIPVYSERGPHGGFSLVRGYRMPPLVFTPEEAVAVYLGTSLVKEVWGQMYRDPAHGALSKLDNVLPDDQRREVAWARRTLLATGMHRTDDASLVPLLVELGTAARGRRRVSMLYRGRGRPEALERDLDPYVLVHRWGWWYVVGYCHLREAMRTFRVDRIVELQPLDQTFEVPDGFDVHKYLAEEAESQRGVHVSLRFPPEVSTMALDDRYFWETVEDQPDGSVIVTQAFPNLDSAARTALSYGPYAIVLKPEELRRLVSERARAIAAQYGPPGQDTS